MSLQDVGSIAQWLGCWCLAMVIGGLFLPCARSMADR